MAALKNATGYTVVVPEDSVAAYLAEGWARVDTALALPELALEPDPVLSPTATPPKPMPRAKRGR